MNLTFRESLLVEQKNTVLVSFIGWALFPCRQ